MGITTGSVLVPSNSRNCCLKNDVKQNVSVGAALMLLYGKWDNYNQI